MTVLLMSSSAVIGVSLTTFSFGAERGRDKRSKSYNDRSMSPKTSSELDDEGVVVVEAASLLVIEE